MNRTRSRSGLSGRYGAAGESAAWRYVYEHYYWDRLPEALASARELGAGSGASGLIGLRTIEGEAMTRERGAMTPTVREWLTLETIVDETPEPAERLADQVVEACDRVAYELGFEHGALTLVTVMSSEADVPWIPGRNGYCVDKHPYDKICIPHSALHDHDDLQHVLLHEYSHVVNLNLSSGRCPLWLDEAVAMVVGGGADRRAWRAFASGRAPWLSAPKLDASFLRNREDAHERQVVWLAYQQSAVLGFYLAELKGRRALGDVMRAFSNNTFLQEVVARLRSLGEVDRAVGEVYGFDTGALFDRAFRWLQAGGHA